MLSNYCFCIFLLPPFFSFYYINLLRSSFVFFFISNYVDYGDFIIKKSHNSNFILHNSKISNNKEEKTAKVHSSNKFNIYTFFTTEVVYHVLIHNFLRLCRRNFLFSFRKTFLCALLFWQISEVFLFFFSALCSFTFSDTPFVRETIVKISNNLGIKLSIYITFWEEKNNKGYSYNQESNRPPNRKNFHLFENSLLKLRLNWKGLFCYFLSPI